MTSRDQPASPATTSLANRYGGQKRSLSGRTKRIILIAALAAGIAFMAWVSTSNATSSVTFKDIGYSTPDGTLAEVDFEVTKDPAVAAKCAVKALDSKFAVVGWKVLDIGPNSVDTGKDGGRTTVHRVQVRTESPAVSAVVDNCWLPDKQQ
ncbi:MULTISPECIES: DUF4307 domain-containing protein [Arthrobacter]|uniref:DUF4307 domain-containing protein n=1 Tax=Arthrobacter oryzae TaxID=409290 RepID=A0A3N0C5H7_9MICC|nr:MULTISPECIES: DUF4307 domain-containing protein [Arthrobacter]QYF90954.1 DUF4307 domain-containing protein [Arthrobacter sp. PAMC25284]RNL58097.1 DUF4307 domain-containing protein [Arthrobacter oryzae]